MAKIIGAVILSLCVAQLALADTKAVAEPDLSTLITSFDDTFQAIHTAFLNIAGVKSDAELLAKAETQVKSFGKALSDQVDELREETKGQTGKISEAFKEFQDKVSQKAEQFKADNPEFFSGDPQKFQEGVEKRYRLILQETEGLRKQISTEGDNVSAKAKKLLDDISAQTVNSAKALQKKVEETTNELKKN